MKFFLCVVKETIFKNLPGHENIPDKWAQLHLDVKSNENCTLDIGIDGEPEVEFNSTAFNETQNYILTRDLSKNYQLFIKEGIGKFLDVYFANETKIHYFLIVFHELPKRNKDLTRKNSSLYEFGIPLNDNMKACVKFNQRNYKNDFKLLQECTDKQGQFRIMYT